MKAQQELFEFLVEKCGGQDAVFSEFYRSKLVELSEQGKSLGDILAVAADEGWDEWLRSVKMNKLSTILFPQAPVTDSTPKPAPRRRGRMTNAERQELEEQILGFVQDNPWCSGSDIAEATDTESRKLSPHLKRMRDRGALKSAGERAAMRYALADETSEP